MSTTSFNQTISASYSRKETGVSAFSNFMTWCQAQEKNRLLWTALALTLHGCVITPITVMCIVYSAPSAVPMIPFTLAMLGMVMVLISNLAALPTKNTIPVFFASILIDIVLIASVFI